MTTASSGQYTFLFTDIEGSTRLWETIPQAMSAALAVHDEIMRSAIEANSGKVIKTVGDAFYAVFETAKSAAQAAVDAQEKLMQTAWKIEGGIRVRMGLYTGEAEPRDNDFFGQTLNRCARLLNTAHGEQVVLSISTVSEIQFIDSGDFGFLDLGEHRLKDLTKPEQIYQLLHPKLRADFPPLRGLESFPNNLPTQASTFVGRERELKELQTMVGQARLVTLSGSGGCGKTRLAMQAAAELLDQFSDGAWFVELAALADPSLLTSTVASVLGLKEEPNRTVQQSLLSYLQTKKLLLILDTCEHLIEPVAKLVQTILASCPSIRVIATSREILGIPGEAAWRVPGMGVPPAGAPLTVSELMGFEAVQLFSERAQASQPSFRVNEQNAKSVAEICVHLDGIPLAIELAAARAKIMTPAQISERLADRFRLLTGGSRTALARQQTLRAAIEWSYDLLETQEKMLFDRSSVFVGGFDMDALTSIVASEDLEEWECLDLLSRLVDKSLLVTEEIGAEYRYRMLESLRAFGQEKLSESGTADSFRNRHAHYYVKLAIDAKREISGSDQRDWLERIERDHDNYRASLSWCLDFDSESALNLVDSLARFWEIRGYWEEGLGWLERVLDIATLAPTELRAEALISAGRLALDQGNYAKARGWFNEAHALHDAAGNRHGSASALNNLGHIAFDLNDYAAARENYEAALEMRRELDDKQGVAASLHNLANVALAQGDYEGVKQINEESIKVFKALGDQRGLSAALNSLGLAYQALGDLKRAFELLERGLQIRKELGDRAGVAMVLSNLGSVAMEDGDLDRARSLFKEGLAIRQAILDKRGTAFVLNNLGRVALAQGDLESARENLGDALGLRHELGDKRGMAETLESQARYYTEMGKFDRAVKLIASASWLRDQIGAPCSPKDRREIDALLERLKGELGESQYEKAQETGTAVAARPKLSEAVSASLKAAAEAREY